MYQPILFIGIGKYNHFFTLRETYMHHYTGAGGKPCAELRSFHHFNLSQNPDEAIAKATEAADKIGLRLETTRAEITEKLEEIKRATAEQMEARQREELRWADERKAAEAARNERYLAQIDAGYFPDCFRKVNRRREPEGQALNKWNLPDGDWVPVMLLREAEVGYLNWLMDKAEEFEPDSLLAHVAAKVIATCEHLRLPRAALKGHVGMVGKRDKFNVTITRVYEFDGFYGITYFTTMVTDNGFCLLSKGRFAAEVGDELKIKATVKEHGQYKDQDQTVVQRVAVEP